MVKLKGAGFYRFRRCKTGLFDSFNEKEVISGRAGVTQTRRVAAPVYADEI